MRTITLQLLAAAALTSGCRVSTAPLPSQHERAALRREIDSLIDAPETRQARWGVLVGDPATGDTLYSRDAGKLFIPASHMKLITAAVALDVLGPDFQFTIPLLARGAVRGGTLDGDLLVVGRGDTSASDNFA